MTEIARDRYGRFVRATPPPSLKDRLIAALNLSSWPSQYTTILALVCGVLTVLNQTTFGLPTAAKTGITVALGAFEFLGIGPLLGPKFKAALHLPAAVGTAISIVLLVALVVVQQDTSLPYSAIVIGVINVLGGLGFEPAFVPTL